MSQSQVRKTRGQVSSAITILSTEYAQVTEEIQAFDQFNSDIKDIDTRVGAEYTADGVSYQQKSTTQGTTQVREMYENTIMSVPHYTKEYADTYLSSISEEFGSDLAAALIRSSDLTPILKSALINQVESIIKSRKQLREIVQVEKSSLNSCYQDLYDAGDLIYECLEHDVQSLDDKKLNEYKSRFSNTTEKFDEIAIDRQQDIRKSKNLAQVSRCASDIYPYLYQSLSTNYPVLETIGHFGRENQKLITIIDNRLS